MGKLKVSYTIDYDGEQVTFEDGKQMEMHPFSKHLLSRLNELECRLKQNAALHWLKQKVSEETTDFDIQFVSRSSTTSLFRV